MAGFFIDNLDYISFVNSLTLIILGITCIGFKRRTAKQLLPWSWLGLFGISHGLYEFMNTFAISLGDSPFYFAVRTCVLWLSFIFLTAFSPAALKRTPGRRLAGWGMLPILGLSALGLFYGWAGLSITITYVLGIGGGLWAAFTLFSVSRNLNFTTRNWLVAAGLAMALLAATYIITPPSPYGSPHLAGGDWFYLTFGFPILLIRIPLTVAIAIAINTQQYEDPSYNRIQTSYRKWSIILVSVFLLHGWLASDFGKSRADTEFRNSLAKWTSAIASTIDPKKVSDLTGSPTDNDHPSYLHLQSLLESSCSDKTHCRAAYLLGYRDNSLIYLTASRLEDHTSYPRPGMVYPKEIPGLLNLYTDKKALTDGPLSNQGLPWFIGFAPVADPQSGKVVAVLGLEISAGTWRVNTVGNRLGSMGITLVLCILMTVFLEMQTSTRISADKAMSSEAKFRSIFENAPGAIFIFDPKARDIVTANPYLLGKLGIPNNYLPDLDPDYLLAMFTQPDKDKILTGMIDLETKGSAVVRDVSCRLTDGRIESIDMICVRMEFEGRECFLVFVQNISEHKRMQKDLIKSKDAAEEASRAKSEFLANMTHEIRTPMNAIMGMTDLLLDTPLSKDQRELAVIVSESANSLMTIINDILDFSKIEAGKMDLIKTNFDPRTLVDGVADLLSWKAREKGLAIITMVDPSVPRSLNGDPGRLRQVLLNLAGNAVKFTSQGEVAFKASTETEDNNRVILRFEISDSGIGIPESAQSQIFLPFTQADGSTTRRYGGTGLGLTISKRLVELMGGEIGMRSVEGQGSTFWFTAPLSRSANNLPGGLSDCNSNMAGEEANCFQAAASMSADYTQSPEILPVKPILLAEDNLANQKLALLQLKKLGYKAQAVNNGREALEAIQRSYYSLVLMDCQMPEMDGFEATAAIRAFEDATGKHIPIVALTAHAMEGDREKCLCAGMDDYISKPLKIEQLNRVLKLWIKQIE